MKIHEYQGKRLFDQYQVPVLKGGLCTTPEEAASVAEELSAPVVVVKSQIHAGGRGKGTVWRDAAMTEKVMDGGVKLAKSPAEAQELANKLLGNYLQTIQTGDGCKQVQRVYVEDGCNIANELYLSILLDRAVGKPLLMASSEGGVDIEEVAASTPERIHKVHFDPYAGLLDCQARVIGFRMGLTPKQVGSFTRSVTILEEPVEQMRFRFESHG